MPRVYNRRNRNVPAEAVYVGRPTVYGNPFEIGRDGTRADVIAKYKAMIEELPPAQLAVLIADLRGKDLVCWCAPLPCHADVLMEIANK